MPIITGLALDLPSSGNDVTFGYSYNPAGEIVSNTRSNDAYSFTLANANVTSTANGLNQLTAVGGASVTYDGNGNVASIGSTGYGYYAENRMAVASPVSGGYLYFDSIGRLSFLYDPTDPAESTRGNIPGPSWCRSAASAGRSGGATCSARGPMSP